METVWDVLIRPIMRVRDREMNPLPIRGSSDSLIGGIKGYESYRFLTRVRWFERGVSVSGSELWAAEERSESKW